ncbi:MAG: nitronate monooxygenase [Betaproteobacteria bacterium]|nr:MAG: nitronate monooxygenase [Betaproteobacteria bacterium]
MISTRFSQMLGLRHPIVLGPMGGVSGGRLAAAVSGAGGLGLIGAGYGDEIWLRQELALLRMPKRAPWGVGFITWSAQRSAVELALDAAPDAIMLSFGDPRPLGSVVKAAGCRLLCQVQDVAGARLARDAGADAIVAQGAEAGGHGGGRGTLALVPAVVDAVDPLLVFAAGGIADGRGLAAALMLGAQGALLGTRFYASVEALGHAQAKERIAAASGDETARTHLFDAVRGLAWPPQYTGRALRNAFLRRWEGRGQALTAVLPEVRAAYRDATRAGDFDTAVVWASEAVDQIRRVERAAALVRRIASEAEALLRSASAHIREAPPARERADVSRHPMPQKEMP